MKIVFLDIDGVLNNADDSDPHTYKDGCYFYSPACVTRLNNITDKTGAKIVVSSTWRLGKTVEQLQAQLLEMGVTGDVIDKTCSLAHLDGYRGNEIIKWVKDNEDLLGYHHYNFKEYVILDDDSDMLLWQKDNFVHTDGYRGLTDSDVYDAISILNNMENVPNTVYTFE